MEKPLPDDEFQVVLQSMTQSGEFDSSGVFTISAQQAQEKLKLFGLPEPRHYVLNALASAVLGGARSFDFQADLSTTTLRYDGATLDKEELQDLLNQLLHPTEKRLQELGVALNACRALKVPEVHLISWDGAAGWCLEMSGGDKLTTSSIDSSPWPGANPGNQLTLRESFTVRRAAQGWWSGFPEQAALAQNCRNAPLKLTVKGRTLSEDIKRGCSSPSCLAWLQLKGSEKGLKALVPDAEWSPACLVLPTEQGPPAIDAVLCLDLPTVAEKEGVQFIVNGVSFTRPNQILQMPFAHGVISCAILDKNVSHTDLAENPTYHLLLKELEALCESLLVRRLASDKPLPENCLAPLLKWVPELSRRLLAKGQSATAASVKRWAKETEFMLDLQSDETWLPLREELRTLTGTPAGAELTSRTARRLLQATLLTLDSGSSIDCRKYCHRLLELADISGAEWQNIARESSLVMNGLCGEVIADYGALGLEARGFMLRLHGHPSEALLYHQEPFFQGETMLALGEFERAETSLREALQLSRQAQTLEALSDCLAFSPHSNRKKRREALALREEALGLREIPGFSWGSYLKDDIVELAAAAAPFHTHITHRVTASLSGRSASAAVRAVEDQLYGARQSLKGGASGIVRLKSALLQTERNFPLNHPFLDATRSRALFRLRKNELWAEADDLAARGHLLLHLHRRFSSDWLEP